LHIGSSCSVFKGLCRSRATTILVYHVHFTLSISFSIFLKKVFLFSKNRKREAYFSRFLMIIQVLYIFSVLLYLPKRNVLA
ncbi:hypothetical protein EAI95_08800, partial [Streptococcus sp. bf_0095]